MVFKVKGTLLEDGSTKTGAPVLIVLSDGESRDRLTQRDQYIIDKFQRDSRLQIAVGVGDNFNRDELERGFILCKYIAVVNELFLKRFSGQKSTFVQ